MLGRKRRMGGGVEMSEVETRQTGGRYEVETRQTQEDGVHKVGFSSPPNLHPHWYQLWGSAHQILDNNNPLVCPSMF